MKFSELEYSRPDFEKKFAELEKLIADFQNATTKEEQFEVLKKVDKLESTIATNYSLAHVRNTIDTNDEFYKAEMEYLLPNLTIMKEKALPLEVAMVNSPFKDYLIEKIGDVPFINAELAIKSFSPECTELAKEESKLVHEYQQMYAKLTVEFDGKTMPLPLLGPYKESLDREVRKAAYIAEGKCFDAVQDKLDDIFDKLVKNRTAQAKIMGCDNFVQLGYMRRRRNCYDNSAVAVFKNQVVSEIVPVVKEIQKNQMKRTEMSELKFYDLPYTFKDGAPKPQVSSEEIIASGKQMYLEMMPETAEFIKVMYDNELFDLYSKDGKAPGGYCTNFGDYKYPFVFANFNDTAHDVDVLTHEMGHAFNSFRGFKNFELSMMNEYSMEIAETHSMAMEFLTAPWHHLFFKQDAAKYKLAHVEGALTFIPYGCQVDEFQEVVYANPDLTPEERNQKWLEIEKRFRPGIEYDEIPFYGRGAGWQRQLHIYMYPFYYIDYCMAQTMALQFYAKFLENKEEAYKMYVDFVDLGGTKTFVDIIKTTGFLSPLEDGSIKSIMDRLKVWLAENQI